MKCGNCGHENSASAKFCENCGRPLERRCPNCGQPVSATAKFCANCGYNLAASAGAVPAPSLASMRQSAPPALQAKVRAAGERAEGERKLVTVLFADIVASTELAEALDPEDWREVVDGAHARISEAIHRYEGHVAQLLGDGVLAFFGAPLTHEDDAERAVRAGLAILDAARAYAAELRPRGLAREFQVRVGLNTGTVVVGSVGSDLHLEYLAVGDTVNLAARVQSAADSDTLLLTESTRHQLGTLFDLEDRGRVSVKGKAEPVQVYRVLGERRGAARTRGIDGVYSPLVGRDRELTTLFQACAELKRGRGGIVSILGEAGLGKTRLVIEWRRAVERSFSAPAGDYPTEPGVRWTVGRCLSYATGLPYHLVADLLRGLIGASREASETEVSAALKRSCDASLGERAGEVFPFLAHLLGLELADADASAVRYLEGAALQTRYAAAWHEYLLALGREVPTILVADDVHWADPSSVEMLSRVLGVSAQAPVMFVFISRPEPDSAGWRLLSAARQVPGVGSIELHLAPLAEGDSEQLVGNLLAEATLPQPLRRLILAKAEGNPFYVEEVIRMLIDHGGLRREGGEWVATRDLRGIEIPDTIQGVIVARVDRLPEEVKRTLQVASVIGRRFQARVLEAVLEELDGKA